jgi:ribosomal protein S1
LPNPVGEGSVGSGVPDRCLIPSYLPVQPTPKEELVGQSIALKLIEVDEERQRLVLSNKRATADKKLDSFQVSLSSKRGGSVTQGP